jgi:hypothetical protein
MKRPQRVPYAAIAALAILTVPIGLRAQAAPQANVISSFDVRPHTGAEAIDIYGHATPGSVLTVTLVSTFSVDVPDVVLSRTYLDAAADGTFSAVISIAPGFTRGSFITVYATTYGGAAKARYLVDAPNHGVIVPLDQVPREDR